MAYPYGTQGAPAIGTGIPGLPRRTGVRGEILYALPGTYLLTVPDGVYSVCAVTIGGGGDAGNNTTFVNSGGAGALAWANDIPVSPGDQITVVVGDRTQASYFMDTNTCAAGGGTSGANTGTASPGAGGTVIAGRGGNGGNGASSNNASAAAAASGGATGGYSGNGANGAAASGATSVAGNAGSGGAGGSGGLNSDGTNISKVGGSGGVSPYGEGASGAGGTTAGTAGGGGSGGQSGINPTDSVFVGQAGLYGAGAGARNLSGYKAIGSTGCVRVLWGDGRAFPSTDVGPT